MNKTDKRYISKYCSKKDRELILRKWRAHDYFMGDEFTTAYEYMLYQLVVNKSVIEAEKILHTPLT